ncbi:pyridoxamine 5'-phosphate oxidase family protein [Brooklawnia cerclae]|uniref:Nitroimidazol reductase NimA-like FMN-containing flavoprotein (Pyridoxamine 5'-phosphate oxidase superfamily) n=1 Tax=Brooklawnia cerclae TaxID=349934 RepID=A0ABX0SG71_9ACTN|nr:pyridoxamine 5'-phosphate oxidase family protein [Brooklawnia cerclae]NIH57395.1 nitroimidazol reductase NimA-like FMN-containing flavoprotein (pyridoxamine 5'-phosphate oxidase superfamily) [Brooklawnia cerclae]
MADATDSPVSVIPEDSCWGYLASQEVGRLGLSTNDVPEIFPVNYCVDGESVIFRSAEGSKMDEIAINNNVVFEVDGWTEEGGWSVMIKGVAERITDADELARARKAPLLPWIPTVKSIFVRVSPTIGISGRRFMFGPEPKQE